MHESSLILKQDVMGEVFPEIVKIEVEAGLTHRLRGFRKPSQPRSLRSYQTSEVPLASATRIMAKALASA